MSTHLNPLNPLNPLLLLDYYKTTHHEQYPTDLTRIVSYFTPRATRLAGQNHLIMFGLQGYLKTYLIRAFQDNFFSRPRNEILTQYQRILDNTLGPGIVNYDKIAALHDLGYLPIQIKALDEGTRVPIKVPMLEITNTHRDFAWLVNTLETSLSCTLWHTMISANVGYMYRQLVNKYYAISVDDTIPRNRALGDFSMRGQESCESAVKSSAAFCLSFLNTATVPAILYLEDNYNCDSSQEPVAYGAISTEHSVMTSNYACDGDELTHIKRLLTRIYPKNSFSMVSDSYDYWHLVDTLLPQCKQEILAHEGFIGIRGDSGNPIDITTRTVAKLWDHFGGTINSKGYRVLDPHVKAIYGDSITPQRAEKIYAWLCDNKFACNNVLLGVGSFSMQCLEEAAKESPDLPHPTQLALNPEISKTQADNASPNDAASPTLTLHPFTRDTYGIAIKATYGEINDQPLMIYKDPKTDSGLKKSQKGCCVVCYDPDGTVSPDNPNTPDNPDSSDNSDNTDCLDSKPTRRDAKLTYLDNMTFAQAESHPNNLLKTVFRDGKMTREQNLHDIRTRLHEGTFF
ncbi:MAG: nicotinamide phosphoribosyltransferase domain-containing protein [Peptococcaceae bacterium]|nr:nicotinamide phosphoribosyltransferase domain-containing protein [Peptococcaceae bacterium]